MTSSPILFAHRGARRERPENTLIAFRHALDLGADALELDVHYTRDHVIVVHHDAALSRSAGRPIAIKDVSWATLQEIDVGPVYRDARGGVPFAGVHVPRLEDVLDEFPGVPLNVDLKPDSAALCDATMRLLRARRVTESVRLASFSGRNLLRVRRAGYEGETSFGPRAIVMLATGARLLLGALGELAQAAQIPTHYGRLRLDSARFVREVRATGAKLHYWTINEPTEAERLLGIGADGIVTDDVRAIRPVFERVQAALRKN